MATRYLTIILSFLLFTTQSFAQELKAKVTVTHNRIQGVDQKVFETLEQSLTTFLNSTKWTNDAFEPNEKIECNFLLNIFGKAGDENIFSATLTIQATRPVFNTDYNSPTVFHQDKDIIFKYEQSQVLQFDENNVRGTDAMVSNLTAVFAYYAYIILGVDYDSFSPDGGTNFFKKAQSIVDKAPEQSKTIRGWKSSENNRNRFWLAEQFMNNKFQGFRTFWYSYHREGLDQLTSKPDEALKKITSGIQTLEKIYKENTNPFILQFYFNAKSTEWANLLRQVPQPDREEYAKRLMAIDITNAEKYRNIK